MALTLQTAPTIEPLTTAEVKAHLRVDVSTEDTLIERLTTAAREYVEKFCRRSLVNQTWDLTLDDWPSDDGASYERLDLPYPPLVSVTSITYLDSDGTSQTLATSVYTVKADADGGYVTRAYGQVWPSLRGVPDSITVRYVAGYGSTAASVPAALRAAILLLVGDMYENREAQIVGTIVAENPTVKNLLWPYRVLEHATAA